jgi:hypothetical protein
MTTTLRRLCAKIYANEPDVSDDAFVPVFHGLIRRRALGGLLLDVADYTHVPEGPGVVLVGYDTSFALDRSDGRFGLLAQRRRPFDGSAVDGVAHTLRALLAAVEELERDSSPGAMLAFDRTTIRIEANDRLRLPNSDAGFTNLRAVVEAALPLVFPTGPVSVTRIANDPRDRLAMEIRLRESDQGETGSLDEAPTPA